MSAPARICLIDDELAVRDALALGLRDAGFEVATAPGAAAGLDILLREGADAVVTDMNMPGTGGAQFIEEARARWPELPIVAISGAAAVGDRGIETSCARARRERCADQAIPRACAGRGARRFDRRAAAARLR